jgi:nucleosome assembly protein 1-like 1
MKRETFDMAALKKKISDMEHDHSDSGCCEHDHDFLQNLPLPIRRRIHALEFLHSKRMPIAAEYRKELLALQRKFSDKYAPLNEERAKIISGKREPTKEELADFSESKVEEVGKTEEPSPEYKGIPNFWVTAFQNHPAIGATFTDEDIEALSSLIDIRVSYFADKPGFKLDFEFGPNEYFVNTVLSKEYHLDDPVEGEQDEFVYDRAVGSEIKWKAGKNSCFKTVTRTQRHRNNNTTRTVKREERQDSFFHFFMPPTIPEGDDEETEDIQEFESMLQVDYEIGVLIKEQIVPNAVDWFTGKALEYAELEDEDYYDEEDEYDEDDEEDDEDEEDEESEEEAPRRQYSKPGNRSRATDSTAAPQEKPECKQQ